MTRTPISYYGGKTKMLKHILPMIPKHKIYVEPYFGGGAVFFAKPKSFLEVINDVDDNVVNFYEILKTRFPELNEMVQSTLFSESQHKKSHNIIRSPKGYTRIQRAWAFWMASNFSFANKLDGGFKFCNGTSGTHSGRMFSTKKIEFHLYENRLKEVQIQNRDALEILKKRNTPESFAFIDPPYPGADQGHYAKTQFTISKLIELMEFLREEWLGTFMLCNYWQKEFENIAKGWEIRGFDMRLSADPRSIRRKKEIIITNYRKQGNLFNQ